ncbi:MAG: hypothetical protein JW841_11490, partial [Deltaproteobacteria bacterium]|nr:hypothetical protein [Deltaproteobacteria bacterium]
AYGAYDSNANVVYLDQKYASDPEFAAYIYSEEAGHFLDTKLKSQDTVGEEGEIFRRLLAGEQISKSEMANLRALNRDGTITVDGKQVSVEFWSLGGVVKGITDAAKSVTGAVTDAAKSVTKGVGEAVSGFAGNIVKGKIDAAFTALGHGFDTAVIKSITQLANGLIDTGAEIVNAVVAITGPAAPYIKKITDRLVDVVRTAAMTMVETVTTCVRDLIRSVYKIAKGVLQIISANFKDGLKNIGKGFAKLFFGSLLDIVMRVGIGALSIVQTFTGNEQPGRRLTDEEIAILRKVYGDSIDYKQVRIKEGKSGFLGSTGRSITAGSIIYFNSRRPTEHEIECLRAIYGDTLDYDTIRIKEKSGIFADNRPLDANDKEAIEAWKSENLMTQDEYEISLIHEFMHVWQNQHNGGDYLSGSLIGQVVQHSYKWWLSVPKTPFDKLEVEQQAQFLEDVYYAGFFDPNSKNYGKFYCNVNGDDKNEDITDYVKQALAIINQK